MGAQFLIGTMDAAGNRTSELAKSTRNSYAETFPMRIPNVAARYCGTYTLKDGSLAEVVSFVVQVAGSGFAGDGLKFPAVRGHVWARSLQIGQYEAAAKAAITIARHELASIGYLGEICEDPDADWSERLYRAVLAELFLGGGPSGDQALSSFGGGCEG